MEWHSYLAIFIALYLIVGGLAVAAVMAMSHGPTLHASWWQIVWGIMTWPRLFWP